MMVANVKECCVREQPKASLNKYVYKSMNVKSFRADRQILYQIHQTQKEAEPIVVAVLQVLKVDGAVTELSSSENIPICHRS